MPCIRRHLLKIGNFLRNFPKKSTRVWNGFNKGYAGGRELYSIRKGFLTIAVCFFQNFRRSYSALNGETKVRIDWPFRALFLSKSTTGFLPSRFERHLFQKVMQKLCSLAGKFLAGLGLHLLREFKQLFKKVVDGVLAVFQRTVATQGVSWAVEGGLHRSRRHEAPRDTDGAEGIQAISVLHDFGFDRSRDDACRKTVGFDCVLDGGDWLNWIANSLQKLAGLLGSQPRGLISLW